jgi:DNA polymerase V
MKAFQLGPSQCPVLLPFYLFRVPAGFPSPAADHLERHVSLGRVMHKDWLRESSRQGAGSWLALAGLLLTARETSSPRSDMFVSRCQCQCRCFAARRK